MTNDIKGLGSPPSTDQNTVRNTGKESATAAGQTAAKPAAPAGVAKAAVESVSLSSNAQALKAVEEKIKAALDSGKYTVDDLVIADKLLGFDELFN
jgi:anti-sigma28 factor (negative regulator of flagellin synthesis)